MNQHTPGPWKLISWTDGASWTVAKKLGELLLANVTGQGQVVNTANARLIAKAPEMLTSIQTMLNLLPQIGFIPSHDAPIAKWVDKARVLLREIEGP